MGFLGRKYDKLVAILPTSFPELHLIRPYVKPCIRSIEEIDQINITLKQPDVAELAKLCQWLFTFGDRRADLSEKFRKLVWHGLFICFAMNQVLHLEGKANSGECSQLLDLCYITDL